MEIQPCLTRITNPKTTQYFADGKHKFYLEYCCRRPCIEGTNKCSSCHKIHSGARSQFDSTYPHGSIDEPIPDHSHIFGGTWYQERVLTWGAPSAEVIALALQYQEEVNQYRTTFSLSKANQPFTSQEMAKSKKTATGVNASGVNATDVNATNVSNDNPPVKRTRKPKISSMTEHVVAPPVEAPIEAPVEASEAPVEAPVDPKPKRKAAKSTKKTKQNSPTISLNEQPICKEVVIPTHIEHQIETVNVDDYEIEYVPLTYIEIDRITYFRDANKNKLYQTMKDKSIGSYVGRYCPHTETICTEVPDSDEENDS